MPLLYGQNLTVTSCFNAEGRRIPAESKGMECCSWSKCCSRCFMVVSCHNCEGVLVRISQHVDRLFLLMYLNTELVRLPHFALSVSWYLQDSSPVPGQNLTSEELILRRTLKSCALV
jgi:hypothetical protein